jgi:DNA polymerase I-like protein with 3'-5' exonuclease and polymerase domains
MAPLVSGPPGASIALLLADHSPSDQRLGQLLSGKDGRLLDMCLTPAGLRRLDLQILVMAPGWQHRLGPQVEVLVPMGDAWQRLLEEEGVGEMPGSLLQWRGSLFPPLEDTASADLYNAYWLRLPFSGLRKVHTLPTFHPRDIGDRMEWHYWLVQDLQRAGRIASGRTDGRDRRRMRQWYLDSPSQLKRLVREVLPQEGIVSIDTEMVPLVTSIVSAAEVHVFTYDRRYRSLLQELMLDPRVVKVAHNMQHDWRQFEKVYEVVVAPPWFDTIAGAHALEPGGTSHEEEGGASAGEQQVGKSLSPHISSRFTPWPFHKWLSQVDMYAYCGMDSVVGYDAYVEQQEQLQRRPELLPILEQDMRLFEPLFRASSDGLLVDEEVRKAEVERMQTEVEAAEAKLERLAEPFILDALAKNRFRKRHLFEQRKQCSCCGGGKKKLEQCWGCAGLEAAPLKPWLLEEALALAGAEGWEREQVEALPKMKKAELAALVLGMCNACGGHGHSIERLPLNLGSSSQVGDLLYRAMRIPARRYQGSETIRFDQLARLLEDGGFLAHGKGRDAERSFVQAYIQLAKVRSEKATLDRMEPDVDGRLHTTFDLWYTPTHRVASREGLLDIGTNIQNIPKESRRIIVADEGHAFLYPDYAQIEGRCQAVLSSDQKLLECYHSGADSHLLVVELLAKEGIQITRDQAKRVSYAAFYDIGAPHLADIMAVSIEDAERVLRAFFKVFSGAARYKQRVEMELRTSRSCTSPTGWRRRWLGYVLETDGKRKGQVRKKLVKEALASGPQNMAAYVMAEGMLRVWDETRQWIKPRAHVHDSCLLAVPLDRLQEAIPLVEELMSVELWGMPFPVESVCGPDWWAASVDDKKKDALGLGEWKRETILEKGAPFLAVV